MAGRSRTVGASVDAWGGYINADLDSIDATVKSVSVVANAAYPASNPSGYQTAAQVASVVIGDNRIINGDMWIDQRNDGASGTALGYTVDRWVYNASVLSKGTWVRNTNNPPPPGFPYSLFFQSTSAYALTTSDFFRIMTALEGDAISDFAWGTANAQPVTLSFWAYSSLIGSFGGSITNYASTRCYSFSYSIPTTNTWTKITITIPGDTAGTWVLSGNAGALYLQFDLGSGATYRAPSGAWTNGNFVGANGTVSVVSTNTATFLSDRRQA